MKIIESWLREWISLPVNLTIEQIAHQLTMAGLEVAEIIRNNVTFSDVVVGEVIDVQSHPDADRLRVCKVMVGSTSTTTPLTIVCGASNVRVGLKVPVALCGAVLPGNMQIKKAKLRGVESCGMLCSAKELNLATTSSGLMELPTDAPVGANIATYLKLNDAILDIELTANRGDCLSVLGVARELAALNTLPRPLAKWLEIEGLTTADFPASQNVVTEIDSSSLVLQQGAPAKAKRSLLDINEHCEQGSNEAASQNAVTEIDSSSLVLQQGAPAESKRSLLNINEHCEQGSNEAASQNAVTEIDSSSLVLQQGAPAESKRSLLNINEHCEQGSNEAASQNAKSISLNAPKACPSYTNCILTDIDNCAITPSWMIEQLEKSGLNSVNPVVDVTNYVMLELGQPLHAFAVDKIDGEITVRYAHPQEKIVTLANSELELVSKDLVIADASKVLALAGIIGCSNSAVSEQTTAIFLESAYFDAETIRQTSQRLGISTDASYRFERGVDPTLQVIALARARQLLLSVVGGKAYKINIAQNTAYLPQLKTIKLSFTAINKLLGLSIDNEKIISILNALEMKVDVNDDVLEVVVPQYRFDINIAEDVIEEVARIYGYDNLPSQPVIGQLTVRSKNQRENIDERAIKTFLLNCGYSEAITYSFVDPHLHQQLCDNKYEPEVVVNPIAVESSVMRTSLWPGLVGVLKYNLQRQQERLRLFEIGVCFRREKDGLRQNNMLAGVVSGRIMPLQWGNNEQRCIDFYDIKQDVVSLLESFGYSDSLLKFVTTEHPVLHPKRSAAIYLMGKLLGHCGELHPEKRQQLEIKQSVYLFELDLMILRQRQQPFFTQPSKFPFIDRDLAVVVEQGITWNEIERKVKENCSRLLQHAKIFDVYQGDGIAVGKKSITLRLRFQSPERTLTDSEVDVLVDKIVAGLAKDLGVVLRSSLT